MANQSKPLKRIKFEEKRSEILYDGVIIKVTQSTADLELSKLLENGVRLLLIQMAYGTRDELQQLILKVRTAIDNSYILSDNDQRPITLLYEIRGRVTRCGRMRNNQSIQLREGRRIVITSNKSYQWCSMKEVIYMSNFEPYIQYLQLNDMIFINEHKIQLVVIKIERQQVTCCVVEGSKLDSYMHVTLPYNLPLSNQITDEEWEDLSVALLNGADYLILPEIVSANYGKIIRLGIESIEQVGTDPVAILANIDLNVIRSAAILNSIIRQYDGFYMKKSFKSGSEQSEFDRLLHESAAELRKPIIWSIPKLCSDKFKLTVDWKQRYRTANSIIIQKFNGHCRLNLTQLQKSLVPKTRQKSTNDSLIDRFDSPKLVTDFAVLASITMKAKLLVTATETGDIPIFLIERRPPCPVLAVTTQDFICRRLNIWRNIVPILHGTVGDEEEVDVEDQLAYGADYARRRKVVKVGDMIVFVHDSELMLEGLEKREEANNCRVIYVPIDKIYV